MGKERSGRKPVPTALRIIRGNPSKKPINKNEPQPEIPNKVPSPPLILKGNKDARKEWKRVATELHRNGLLTNLELPLLADYCLLWSRYVSIIERLKEEEKEGFDPLIVRSPKGYEQQKALIGMAHTVAKEMRSCMIEFGMTPSSRSRMNIKPIQKESKLDRIRNKGKK